MPPTNRGTIQIARSQEDDWRDALADKAEQLIIREFHLALRDRQLGEEQARELFNNIVMFAAKRGAEMLAAQGWTPPSINTERR